MVVMKLKPLCKAAYVNSMHIQYKLAVFMYRLNSYHGDNWHKRSIESVS